MVKYTNPNPNLHIDYLKTQLVIVRLIKARKVADQKYASAQELLEEEKTLRIIIEQKSNQQTK